MVIWQSRSNRAGKKCPRVPVWVRGGGVNAIWAMPTWRWWQAERGFPNIGTSASFQGLMNNMLSSRSGNHANRVERQILFSVRKKTGAYSAPHYLFLALPLRPLFGLYLYLRATSLHSPLVYKHNLHMYTWRQSNTLGIAAHVHLAVLQPLMFKV